MEEVIIVASRELKHLETKVNRELRTLNGTLVDIKYSTTYVTSADRVEYSALIIYKRSY